MMTPEERMKTDPMFYSLVNTLRAFLHNAEFTPSELRDAVILAATLNELYKEPRPIYVERMNKAFGFLYPEDKSGG